MYKLRYISPKERHQIIDKLRYNNGIPRIANLLDTESINHLTLEQETGGK